MERIRQAIAPRPLYIPRNEGEYQLAKSVLQRTKRRRWGYGLLTGSFLTSAYTASFGVGTLFDQNLGLITAGLAATTVALGISSAGAFLSGHAKGREVKSLRQQSSPDNPLLGKITRDTFWDRFSDVLTVGEVGLWTASLAGIAVPPVAAALITAFGIGAGPWFAVKAIDMWVGHSMLKEAREQKRRYEHWTGGAR